jgi:prepilin-type N-terminal cleavage/methylation domain-containing protein
MFKFLSKRPAFSMLELVFVIVVLGIVASIGSELIAKVYQNYIVQRALHRSSTKTELVANQLVNRLSYAIPRSIIGRIDASSFLPINRIPAGAGYRILEWVAYDNDSFTSRSIANRQAGWSGFVDVDVNIANKNRLSTKGSDLGISNTIIANLSNSSKNLSDAVVFFPNLYDETSIGYTQTARPAIRVSPVQGNTNATQLDLDTPAPRIKEQYKLAWSAYAIVPVAQANGLFSLNLHYNFQPWDGSFYTTGSVSTLIRNVSVFNFTGAGNTIRFKLCVQEDIGTTVPITTCKEKVVFR